MTTYMIYYTKNGVCQSQIESDMGIALKELEALRLRRRDGENITHITFISENIDLVGQMGVDSVVDGKTPDGVDYTWKKRRL